MNSQRDGTTGTLLAALLLLTSCATTLPRPIRDDLQDASLSPLQTIRLETLRRGHKFHVRDLRAMFWNADTLVRESRWKDARELYTNMISEYPSGHQTYLAMFWLTVCDDQLGRLENPQKAYQRYLDDKSAYGDYARFRTNAGGQQSVGGDGIPRLRRNVDGE